jgi:hypothetical protein
VSQIRRRPPTSIRLAQPSLERYSPPMTCRQSRWQSGVILFATKASSCWAKHMIALMPLLLLGSLSSVADETNVAGRGISLMGPEGVRSEPGGKSFEYVCRLMHVYASDYQLSGNFVVEQGTAKGRKIILSMNPNDSVLTPNDHRLQQMATRFVSRTATNIRIRITLAGELFRESTVFAPANKVIMEFQEVGQTDTAIPARKNARANGALPRN